jgi:TolB-like protein/tetratricopeptide (TPR) repeat protein
VNLNDLRERRIVQFLVTYAAAGWIVLQLVDQVVDRSVLPEVVYRVVLTLVVCGLPGVLIASWYHGAKGAQSAPAAEKWLLGVVALFAVCASVVVAPANLTHTDGAAAQDLLPFEDPSRVAVLYFDAQGGGEDAEFLASGLTESLIDELSSVEALHVISSSGSAAYRHSDAGPDSIGRALGVGTLVNGRVAVAGDRVRVTVSTVAARDGSQLESTRLERPRAQLFDLQDTLSLQVTEFLRRAIGREVGQVLLRSGTGVVEAWELVQKADAAGRHAGEAQAHGDMDGASAALLRADSLLALAEEEDPRWVEPVVRRGWIAYRQSRLGGFDRSVYDRWIGTGLQHADRALAVDPDDADVLELKGTLLYWRYLLNLAGGPDEANELFHEAENLFRASVEANNRQASALTSLSHLLMNKGQVAQAKIAAQRSYEADPFLENVNLTLWRLAVSSWDLGDEVEARRWCDEALRRFPEEFRFHQCQLRLFALPAVEPDVPAAWAHHTRFVELSPHNLQDLHEKQGLQYMAMALVRAGLPDSARAVALRGRAQPYVDPVRDVTMLEAVVRSWLGDADEAVRLMGVYLAANPSQVEAYRESLMAGNVHWYQQELAELPEFRFLVGLN